jgi:hypothetical protein
MRLTQSLRRQVMASSASIVSFMVLVLEVRAKRKKFGDDCLPRLDLIGRLGRRITVWLFHSTTTTMADSNYISRSQLPVAHASRYR